VTPLVQRATENAEYRKNAKHEYDDLH
jgi:hypothetical protein